MNGLALLVATAALGVDFGWQPTTDGQLEYIIQMEPVTLVALRGGQELVSQIDPYVQGVRRFRIRVGGEMVPRRGQPPRQPAPPQGIPVPAGVQYGWRGIDHQQMEFIIQLSHERLVLMRGGEDLVGEIPVELPHVTQFRVRSGVEPPPRQMPQVASADLSVPQTATVDPAAREMRPGTDSRSDAPSHQPGQTTADAEASMTAPQRPEVKDRPPQEPRPSDGQTGQPPPASGATDPPTSAKPSATPPDGPSSWLWSSPDPPAGESQWSNESRTLTEEPQAAPVEPQAAPVEPRAGTAQPKPTGPNAWQSGALPESPTQDATPAPKSTAQALQPSTFPDWGRDRSSDAATQQPAGPAAQQDRSIYDDPRATTQAPLVSTTPPTVPLPYTPQWSTGQSPQEANHPPPSQGHQFAPASSRPWDMTAEPRLPWERRLLYSDFPSRRAKPAKDFWASLAQTAQDPSLAYLRSNDSPEMPWGTLTLVLMVLFISLGANLYMGWIAVDMYHRYLELADDLAENESPSRNSLDQRDELYDDLLDDQDEWDDAPRGRRRASMIA